MATPEPNNAPIVRYLDTVGDGSGDTNMAVDGDADGTGEITRFRIRPAASEKFLIKRAMFLWSDATAFKPDTFGAITALTNGVLFQVEDYNGPTARYTLHPQGGFKDNQAIAAVMHDVETEIFNKAGLYYTARGVFTFSTFTESRDGGGILLNGRDGDELVCVIQDDLTGLDNFYIAVEGQRIA